MLQELLTNALEIAITKNNISIEHPALSANFSSRCYRLLNSNKDISQFLQRLAEQPSVFFPALKRQETKRLLERTPWKLRKSIFHCDLERPTYTNNTSSLICRARCATLSAGNNFWSNFSKAFFLFTSIFQYIDLKKQTLLNGHLTSLVLEALIFSCHMRKVIALTEQSCYILISFGKKTTNCDKYEGLAYKTQKYF